MENLNKNKLKVVMVGCLETGWEVIRHLLANNISISYFVTISPEKAEQQNVAGYQSYFELAKAHNIPVYIAKKYSLKSTEDLNFFKDQKFDLVIQGGWQRIFPEVILNTLSIGAVGIHGSSELLPKGRGRSPINWSIIKNKKRFIIHYFMIKPGIDDGDVFHFESFDINEWDTCRTLYYKNSIVTKRVILEWLPKLVSNNFKVIPQIGKPTYYLKRTAEDGLINWDLSLLDIYNFIRALTHPYPGAFSFIKKDKIKIWKAYPFDTRIVYNGSQEGEIVEIFQTGDFIVNANGGLLLVTEYEFAKVVERGQVLH